MTTVRQPITVQTLKRDLLADAARKNVHQVLQLDGWLNTPTDDALMGADSDGDALMAGFRDELRCSPAALAVRVHIHVGTPRADAVRLLRKLSDGLERDEWLLDPEHMREG